MIQSTLRRLLRRASINPGVAANIESKCMFTSLRIGQKTPSGYSRLFSSDPKVPHKVPTSGSYVMIDHSEAYEAAMQGGHGDQLALARQEGQGKDDPPFDPFVEFDLDGTNDDDHSDEDLDEIDEIEDEYEEGDEITDRFNTDGSVRRSKSVLATLRAGFPAGGQFAVIKVGGAQHKVTSDDLIVVNRLKPVDKYKVGSVHTLTDVMLIGSSHKTLVGMPFVKGAEVDVMIEEITRDGKLIVFKKRRRKNSQRKNGFRRDVTLLRVLDVRFPEEHRDHNHVGREVLEELEEAMKTQQSGSKQNETVA